MTEQDDIIERFSAELRKPTGDGKKKRDRGEKPPWYWDTHEAQVFSHLAKWKRGEIIDPDSGAHTLVHAAWRLLAIACKETGNVPAGASALKPKKCDDPECGICQSGWFKGGGRRELQQDDPAPFSGQPIDWSEVIAL